MYFHLQNGFLSALPYLGCYIGQLSSGIFADYLRSNAILSTLATRRILTTFGKYSFPIINHKR